MITMHKACFIAAAFLISAPAMAQPVVSGKYLITTHRYCIPTMTVHTTNVSNVGTFVDQVTLGGSSVHNSLYLGTFSPTKQTVSITGFEDEGDVMLMQYTGVVNGNSGSPFSESAGSGKASYSNTDTTITINGQVFNAFFGQLDKNNIAHYIATQAVYANESGQSCSEQAVASRQ